MTHHHPLHKQFSNRFNAAAWIEAEQGNTMLLLRDVKTAARPGEPDKGDMVLLERDGLGNVTHESPVWRATDVGDLLEDPRALVLDDGRVMLGLTAVSREDGYRPYPAVTTLDKTRWRGDLPGIEVIKDFGPGKNTTPIDSETFFYRREGEESNHRLFIFKYRDRLADPVGEIYFPKDIPWAKWRIGTTMSPIWINDTDALMIIHGITQEGGKFIYSLGRARLYKNDSHYEVQVDPEPLLTPDHFVLPSGEPLVEELHPELRRVVYACGGVVKDVDGEEILNLYVNVGDRHTVECPLSMDELKKSWQ